MRITLTVTEGPHQGQVFTFDGHDTFLVGRSKRAHFRLASKDRYISRIHFLVEVNPPHCRLMDMSSSNGTYVNSKRIERTDLRDGDLIKAGETVLQVAVTAEAGRSGEHPIVPPTLPPAASPGVSRSGGSPLFKPPDVLLSPGPSRSGKHPALPPTLPSAASPGASRSGGHAALRNPEPPAPARSTLASEQDAPVPPPVALPSSVQPSPPRPAPPGVCAGCGALLAGDADGSLCPACQEQSRTQRQTIEGYQLVRELGRGSMGLVYLAVQRAAGRPVALKTIIPAAGGNEAQIQRFLREANVLRNLEHPNIVAFRDMGQSGGMLYFAMDYIRGEDAYKLLKKQGPFDVRRAASLICQLLDALAFAHGQGFVHRDIKPSNLLITQDKGVERLMVADFGLAKVYQASNLSGLTMTGDVGGTIPFMAPEQITEYRTARPPVDQYSAAASLYNLLTGAYVYNFPGSFQDQLLTILQENPLPIRKRRPDLPEALATLIHRGLKREPAERFPDAAAMRDALRKFTA